jgi:deoxyribodipyrimidine photolyase-like uncharacterized protein
MKSRSKELLDRAVAATVAAIEIYNKPHFLYREKTFAVLAENRDLTISSHFMASSKKSMLRLLIIQRGKPWSGTFNFGRESRKLLNYTSWLSSIDPPQCREWFVEGNWKAEVEIVRKIS